MERAMRKADVINITAMPRLDDPGASEDIIDELYAGVGILLHVAGSGNEIEPKEIAFIAEKLHETLNQLQRSLSHERREPQP